jgi:hypothetical protein
VFLTKTDAQINDRHDLSAQLENAFDLVLRVRQRPH